VYNQHSSLRDNFLFICKRLYEKTSSPCSFIIATLETFLDDFIYQNLGVIFISLSYDDEYKEYYFYNNSYFIWFWCITKDFHTKNKI
jgi:hypothetical protein